MTTWHHIPKKKSPHIHCCEKIEISQYELSLIECHIECMSITNATCYHYFHGHNYHGIHIDMLQHLLVTQSCKGQQTSEEARCYKMEQNGPWQPWVLNTFDDIVAVGKMGTRLLLPRPFSLTGDINRRTKATLGFTIMSGQGAYSLSSWSLEFI